MAANLIEGSLRDVIQFLDGLSSGESRVEWKQAITSVEWARIFLSGKSGG